MATICGDCGGEMREFHVCWPPAEREAIARMLDGSEVASLRAEVERVTAERDAARRETAAAQARAQNYRVAVFAASSPCWEQLDEWARMAEAAAHKALAATTNAAALDAALASERERVALALVAVAAGANHSAGSPGDVCAAIERAIRELGVKPKEGT